MRKLAVVLIVAGVIGPFASIFQAQELALGKWTGKSTNPQGVAQDITFEFATTPDPLARWRVGTGVFLIGTLTAGQAKLPLRDIRLDGEKLSYVATQPNGVQQQCSLTRQKDGSFAGKCVRTGGNRATLETTMIPPKEETTPSKETTTPPKE
jgi:hypothetical protein